MLLCREHVVGLGEFTVIKSARRGRASVQMEYDGNGFWVITRSTIRDGIYGVSLSFIRSKETYKEMVDVLMPRGR